MPAGPSAAGGYQMGDTTLVQIFGVAAGFASALVLALYLDGESVAALYSTPEILWAAVPVFSRLDQLAVAHGQPWADARRSRWCSR